MHRHTDRHGQIDRPRESIQRYRHRESIQRYRHRESIQRYTLRRVYTEI